jgi:hypothetical protein
MAEAKKKTQKRILDLNEAAELLGITPEDLMQSRGRGMAPGIAGYKKDGVLVWNRSDLKPAPASEDDS